MSKNKHNKPPKGPNMGMMAHVLKNWVVKYFNGVLAEEANVEYHEERKKAREERAFHLMDILWKLESVGQEYLDAIRNLPAKPVEPRDSKDDAVIAQYMLADDAYTQAAHRVAKGWQDAEALATQYVAMAPIDAETEKPVPNGYACKFYLQAMLKKQAVYYRTMLEAGQDVTEVKANMVHLAADRDAVSA